MGALVLDSSIVIGFSRPDDTLHDSAVATIRSAREHGDVFVLPASVLAESLVAPNRISRAVAAEVRHDLVALFGPVRIVDEEVAATTAEVRTTRPSVRLPDALVIATAIVDDAVVLTYDQRLGGADSRVVVLEP
jgi:predicted nucleic acid-binding protein